MVSFTLEIARLNVNGISTNEHYRQTRGCRMHCVLNQGALCPNLICPLEPSRSDFRHRRVLARPSNWATLSGRFVNQLRSWNAPPEIVRAHWMAFLAVHF